MGNDEVKGEGIVEMCKGGGERGRDGRREEGKRKLVGK